jgi:hypothetical protein
MILSSLFHKKKDRERLGMLTVLKFLNVKTDQTENNRPAAPIPIGCATTKNGYFQLIVSCDSLLSDFCVNQYNTEVTPDMSRRLFDFVKIASIFPPE